MVLLCGIPGCGKDVIGRRCASSLNGAALSRMNTMAMLWRPKQPWSPCWLKDFRPSSFCGTAWKWATGCPTSWRRDALDIESQLFGRRSLAQHQEGCIIFGQSGRLLWSSDFWSRSGHETLTITDGQLAKPAQVCLNFLQMFRAPSAPGEVDAVLTLPFLQSDEQTLEILGT